MSLPLTGDRSSNPSPKTPSKTHFTDLFCVLTLFPWLAPIPSPSLRTQRDTTSLVPTFCPSIHPLLRSSTHPSNIPPAGSLYLLLLQMARSSFVVWAFGSCLPPRTCEPQMVSRLSRVLRGATYAQSSFPQMTFPAATIGPNNNRRNEGDGVQ